MKNKAVWSVLGAGISWGIISLFINPLSAGGLDARQICLVRSILAFIFFFAALALTRPEALRIRLRDCPIFIGTGVVSVTLFNCFYFYAMVEGEVSVAVVLLYTSPVFIMLLSRLLFKERITRRKLLGLALTLCGCVLVSGLIGSGVTISVRVLLAGLGAGLFYGLYTIFGKFALARYESLTVSAYTFLFAAAGTLFIGKPAATWNTLTAQPTLWLYALGITLFSTVLPYFLYTWGLAHMDPGRAAILVAVEPLVGALLGIVFYHENHGVAKIAGIICILTAVILLGQSEHKKN